jgi:alkanesulfonate monooxygenase SsuD/methylene tetrahydromethanopterin reductase-like flavin-dependent oxidoreductase (luciferase family)
MQEEVAARARVPPMPEGTGARGSGHKHCCSARGGVVSCGISRYLARLAMRPISVLDTQPPGEVPLLVAALEPAGFYRYWASEHYSPSQSASPLLVAGLAAGLTERMRVGTAGVLLRCTSAVRVAADAAALEMFFPGRIDLGVASAFPGREYTAAFAPDVNIADDKDLEDRLLRLKALLRGDTSAPLVGPRCDTTPSLWLCGTSMRSADLAGRLRANFAFHAFLAPSSTSIADVAQVYRDRFNEASAEDRSTFAVAAYGACGSNVRDAMEHWTAYCPQAISEPSFVGAPRECAEQIGDLVVQCNADEIVVDCFSSETSARVDALTALADAWRAANV